jgi:hypothetical protein
MKILDLGGDKITLPESWQEVSFNQYIKLAQTDNTDLDQIAILTGADKEKWAASKDTSKYYYCFNEISKWLKSGADEMLQGQVKSLEYLTKNIDLGDLGEETVKQFEDLKIIADKFYKIHEIDPIRAMKEYYPLMCSIYLQPKAFKEDYSYDKAKALVPQIEKLDAPTVIGVVNFFLLRYTASLVGIRKGVPKESSPLKRWRQALTTYIRRLVFRQYSTRLQREISRKKITFYR